MEKLFEVNIKEINDRESKPRRVAINDDGTVVPTDGSGNLKEGEYCVHSPEPEGEEIAITFSTPSTAV